MIFSNDLLLDIGGKGLIGTNLALKTCSLKKVYNQRVQAFTLKHESIMHIPFTPVPH